jgi:hypothetical protein
MVDLAAKTNFNGERISAAFAKPLLGLIDRR